jgi:CubicO group peptidase (beta-lactamase class C family)
MIGRREWLRDAAGGLAAAWAGAEIPATALAQATPSAKGKSSARYVVRRPALGASRTSPAADAALMRPDPRLEEQLDPIRAEHRLPGLIGAVVRGERIASIAAVGVRRLGSSDRLRITDQVHLGSCTKAMTATMIGLLVEDGLLTWSSTVRDVFPEVAPRLHPDFQAVTLSQLLTHRAGLPHDASWWRLAGRTPTDQRRAALLALMATAPLSRPGSTFAYSNAGYVLAGLMAEQVTAQPWDELMRQIVFESLGMASAGFGPPGGNRSAARLDAAWGHREVGGRLQAAREDNAPCMGPAGTVHCTLSDWGRFASLHLLGESGKDHLLKPATLKVLHTPPPGHEYAAGWYAFERPWAGGRALMHNGSNTTWYCTVWLAPARGFATLVATNLGGDAAAAACDQATGTLISLALSAPARKTQRR